MFKADERRCSAAEKGEGRKEKEREQETLSPAMGVGKKGKETGLSRNHADDSPRITRINANARAEFNVPGISTSIHSLVRRPSEAFPFG
jgi:hypothetical protein